MITRDALLLAFDIILECLHLENCKINLLNKQLSQFKLLRPPIILWRRDATPKRRRKQQIIEKRGKTEQKTVKYG